MLYRFLPIVPVFLSVSVMAGQGIVAEHHLNPISQNHKEAQGLEFPARSITIPLEQWLGLGLDIPKQPERNNTEHPFQLNITAPEATVIEVTQNITGAYEFHFSSSTQRSEPEKTIEGYDYIQQLTLLAQKKVSFLFDPAADTLIFQYAGLQFVVEGHIEVDDAEPDRSLSIAAETLAENTLQSVTSLILFLDEHYDSMMPMMAFSGGIIEKTAPDTYSLEINPLLLSPPVAIDLTHSDHDQQCLSLSQRFRLIVSAPRQAAIVGDPSSKDEPVDGTKKSSKKTKYTPAPNLSGFTVQGMQSTLGGSFGTGSNAGDDDNDPPDRIPRNTQTIPADKNDLEDDEEEAQNTPESTPSNLSHFEPPSDDEEEEDRAQERADRDTTRNAQLTRGALQGRRTGRQFLDVIREPSGRSNQPQVPPSNPKPSVQLPPEDAEKPAGIETLPYTNNAPRELSRTERDKWIDIDGI